MNVKENDQIIDLLDSIEAAIGEEAWGTSPPPSDGASGERISSIRAAPSLPAIRAELRVYPDAPPRPAGIGRLTRGSTGEVLARFNWGITK